MQIFNGAVTDGSILLNYIYLKNNTYINMYLIRILLYNKFRFVYIYNFTSIYEK